MTDAPISRNVFPTTLPRDWFDRLLGEGESGRQGINGHIMSVYAHPLKVYFRGSSFRNLGDPDDVVDGFFADRLARPTFIEDWRQSGKRLRRWLMNALVFYLRELIRTQKRWHGSLAGEAEAELSHVPMAEGAWAASLVRHACEATAASCERDGLQAHWDLFFLHRMKGQSYVDLSEAFDVTPKRASVMVRTVERRFREHVRRSIMLDGVPESEVDQELRDLLEVL